MRAGDGNAFAPPSFVALMIVRADSDDWCSIGVEKNCGSWVGTRAELLIRLTALFIT